MQAAFLYTLGSVIVVSLVSLLGAVAISIQKKLLHRLLLVLVSFSAAALLGDVFFHLLPELAEDVGFGPEISAWILLGIIAFFLIEKFICWHHCHTTESCDEHAHGGKKAKTEHHPLHRFGHTILLGDVLHNFMDGLVIAGSYLVSIPVGIATTIAVVLHEIPQELGDFGVLVHAGHSTGRALFLNFITALSAVVGGVIGLFLGNVIEGFLPAIIAFTAGSFIYIAAADLIPELHKEARVWPSVLQFAGFLLGLLAMYGLLFFE